jgi:hypothetical protein
VPPRREGLTEEQAGEVADLYQEGHSLAWIANHFGGIAPTTVLRILHKRGIPAGTMTRAYTPREPAS